MNKAKELLLTLLPSASTIVRRAAAEGLGLLATVGVTEDAHFLQSTVLHSLDEVMQGNKPDGKPRALALEPVSAARAGSLLTLAYIQRTAHKVAQKQEARARARSLSDPDDAVKKGDGDLPLLQMMTRILPSVACHGFRDYFVVRTYALHSFAILVSYSGRLDTNSPTPDSLQLLRKGIELVEENFVACWTAASNDVDRGQEAEKMATETAFLAVLLRLMTLFLPYTRHLTTENPDIARRFCTMVALTLESHASHPVVFLEAMTFYEVAESHQELLPSPAKHVLFSENPVFTCVPAIMAMLSPDRPSTWANESLTASSIASVRGVRAAALVARILSAHGTSVTGSTDMRIVSLLTASLETTCGSRRYHYADMTRSMAASREVEELYHEQIPLENELCSTLADLLVGERIRGADENEYLRWVLFARTILSGSSGAEAEERERFSRSSVVCAAARKAHADAEPVLKAAAPIRWQTKSMVARLAVMAIEALRSSSLQRGKNTTISSNFNFTLAEKECSRLCRIASEEGGALPESRLVFHLEEVLSCACMSSVATIDQAELYSIQEVAMHFLSKLIECFSGIPDPEDPNSSILDQYSTQIFSTAKHAISAADESDSAAALRLFVAGCRALQSIVETRLTSDLMVLKRLLRPIVPVKDAIPIFRYGEKYPISLQTDSETEGYAEQRMLLPMLAKLWASGALLLGNKDRGSTLQAVAKDLIADEVCLAVHSAAAGLDGARLLHQADLSLVGHHLHEPKGEPATGRQCGFFYQNPDDIDDTVKTFLVTKWASLVSCAVRPLLDAASSRVDDKDMVDVCVSWIQAIIPLLLTGINDSLDFISDNETVESSVFWAKAVDPERVVVDCMRGLLQLIGDECRVHDGVIGQEMDGVIEVVSKSIIRPFLNDILRQTDEVVTPPSDEVIEEACSLLCSIASSGSPICEQDSALLVALLTPLESLEKGLIPLEDKRAEGVVSACLIGVASLISKGRTTDALAGAMVELVLTCIFSDTGKAIPDRVKSASKHLLRTCLLCESISVARGRKVAQDLASTENWEAWIGIATIQDGSLLPESLRVMQQKLGDGRQPTSQLAALSAVRTVMQEKDIPDAVVGLLFYQVGGHVLSMLHQYGSQPGLDPTHRTTACSDAMKILLLAHQHLNTDPQAMIEFLPIFLEALLAVLRYNGLPNHPSTGEPALGQMCARAMLHIARVSPDAFKATVASLAEHDRNLLQFAVRAEMTGYTAAEPAKKKLSLKGFQK